MNIETETLELILNRKQHESLLKPDLTHLKDKRVLITGANGAIGNRLCTILGANFITYLGTDIVGNYEQMDVTDEAQVKKIVAYFKPDIIINLAGAKHAPEGEITTCETFKINTVGTQNILNTGVKTILSSTCKACNPETAYGASKLIAERLVLNAGGTVVRFYNVVETDGNVFELWEAQKKNGSIQVVENCERYFIGLEEAVGITLMATKLEKGRYSVCSPQLINIKELANKIYPDSPKKAIPARRGDRLTEKLISTSEVIEKTMFENSIIKIKSYHDKWT